MALHKIKKMKRTINLLPNSSIERDVSIKKSPLTSVETWESTKSSDVEYKDKSCGPLISHK